MNQENPARPDPTAGPAPLPPAADPLIAGAPSSLPSADDPAPAAWAEPYPAPQAYPYPAPPGGSGYPPARYVPPGYPMPDLPAGTTNGVAIVSLVLAVLGVIMLSIPLGIIALSQLSTHGGRGRALAIAGLGISTAWVAVLAAVISNGAFSSGNRTTATTPVSMPTATASATATTPFRTGSTSGPGQRLAKDLTLGDCLSYVDANGSPDEFVVRLCSQDHGGEVFDIWAPPSGAHPGDAEMEKLAGKHCDKTLDRYAVGKFADARLVYIYPSRRSPKPRVICIAVPPSGQWTGSMVYP
ncbi:DUF4190 domain-containing protein [Actinoplanes awajinensis]|uniref:DUF4190 domain-containing protein n=1 Tax=Actinoplanes awajinensis subsp. mycoplanecinus TaxID=135947 RepID=A0A124G8D1_9ACTN|nr:DUF4190 domain-containing protein [Actinoplanes awajinensis]KUL25510.1 hypothetical protein ADL15_40615 [Actinoplanes awajinensis subsp. mycoplanecinus]